MAGIQGAALAPWRIPKAEPLVADPAKHAPNYRLNAAQHNTTREHLFPDNPHPQVGRYAAPQKPSSFSIRKERSDFSVRRAARLRLWDPSALSATSRGCFAAAVQGRHMWPLPHSWPWASNLPPLERANKNPHKPARTHPHKAHRTAAPQPHPQRHPPPLRGC